MRGKHRKRGLIISMPPRHGKSCLISQYLPAWFLGMWPDKRVILASYEATFAASWGRKSRDVLREFGYRLFGVNLRDDSAAATAWNLEGETGGMVTAGVGGALTGHGAHLLVIDDPVKNWEEANSQLIRDRTWDWFRTVAMTRLETGGNIVVVMTRWHPDDLVGRLIKSDASKWDVVRIPALAGEGDPLGRMEGEALWPKRYSADELGAIKNQIGEFFFDALYQQNPRNREVSLFQRGWFEVVDIAPRCPVKVRYWDLAATTKKRSDWTVGALLGMSAEGMIYVLDVKRFQAAPHQVEAVVGQTAKIDGIDVIVRMEQEAGAAGVALKEHYARDVLRGFCFDASKSTGNKETRAFPLASFAQSGNIKLQKGAWIEDFLAEFENFPQGQHDDIVDSVGGAFSELTQGESSSVLGTTLCWPADEPMIW